MYGAGSRQQPYRTFGTVPYGNIISSVILKLFERVRFLMFQFICFKLFFHGDDGDNRDCDQGRAHNQRRRLDNLKSPHH